MMSYCWKRCFGPIRVTTETYASDPAAAPPRGARNTSPPRYNCLVQTSLIIIKDVKKSNQLVPLLKGFTWNPPWILEFFFFSLSACAWSWVEFS